MSLIVPPGIKAVINPQSGFIKYSSKYGKKNLKGLFLLPENQTYLSKELFQMICSAGYVKDVLNGINAHLDHAALIKKFQQQRKPVYQIVPRMVEEWQLPYQEDLTVSNPVQALHVVNFDFLRTTSTNIIQNPEMLINNIFEFDPDTNQHDVMEYGYGASSYSDGTWHPEHLFTESKRNRENPYWKPVDITFDSNPAIDSSGLFQSSSDHYSLQNRRTGTSNKTRNKTATQTGVNRLAPGNRYHSKFYGDNGFSQGGQFPAWQHTVSKRPYERDNSEGLGEGGRSDRRIQATRGYDMSALLSKPTY